MRDLRAPRRPQRVEELLQGGRVTSRRGPHQPTGVVVDHDQQVQVPTLVGDLVDADPPQPGEPIRDGSTSAHTRATIAPTVRHAIRINCDTAVLEVWVANQATCSSKT